MVTERDKSIGTQQQCHPKFISMVFSPLQFYNNFYHSNNHQLHIGYHRHLRDSFYGSASNHSRQHYTYQYMSYNDNNSESTTDTSDHSITTSVSIRVTPVENYYVSWGILWSAFVIASIVATWQVYREHRIFHLRRLAGKNTITATARTATSSKKNNNATSSTSLVGSSNDNGDADDDMNTSNNKQSVNVTTMGDGESVSTADLTRSMVRQC